MFTACTTAREAGCGSSRKRSETLESEEEEKRSDCTMATGTEEVAEAGIEDREEVIDTMKEIFGSTVISIDQRLCLKYTYTQWMRIKTLLQSRSGIPEDEVVGASESYGSRGEACRIVVRVCADPAPCA
jgi:hypothetical protein